MPHSQLKINNQVTALVLFMLAHLTNCNCGNNDNQDPWYPQTSSDTNTGGTNTGTENTEEAKIGTANPGQEDTGGTNISPISIIPQRIDELLQELKGKLNPTHRPAYIHLRKFLKQVKAKEDISDFYQRTSLVAAIQYNLPRDVLKLTID